MAHAVREPVEKVPDVLVVLAHKYLALALGRELPANLADVIGPVLEDDKVLLVSEDAIAAEDAPDQELILGVLAVDQALALHGGVLGELPLADPMQLPRGELVEGNLLPLVLEQRLLEPALVYALAHLVEG